MNDNFKKYAIKSLMLIETMILFSVFLDALVGGILTQTKFSAYTINIGMFGAFCFGGAGVFLIMLVLICIRYFSKKHKKEFDLSIFICAIISTVANIVFLAVTFSENSVNDLGKIGNIPFLTYIILSIFISVSYLMEYIDLSKNNNNLNSDEIDSKKTTERKANKKIYTFLIATFGALCLVMFSLFAGFTVGSEYSTYKDKISYRDEIVITRSTESLYTVECNLNIYLRDIDTYQSFEFKVDYTLNGEKLEYRFLTSQLCEHPKKKTVSWPFIYKNIYASEIVTNPILTIDKVSYLENGQYVELNTMEEMSYKIDTKERIFLYSGITLAVVEGVMVALLIVENKKAKNK